MLRPSTRDRSAGLPAQLAVVVASLLLGGATSFAQTWLPDALAPLANSASGWTVPAAGLAALVRPSRARGAVLGGLSFVALVLGYTLVAEARGFPYDPGFWLLVGVLTGPVIGACAVALRQEPRARGRSRPASSVGCWWGRASTASPWWHRRRARWRGAS